MIPFPRKGSKGSEASQDSQGFPIVPLSKAVISTDRICVKWDGCIEMRCALEWRNLRGTSGKGLKTQTITAHPYQVTLSFIGTFE